MISAKTRIIRIPPLRPLRPPNSSPPNRPFTQNTQLLLLARAHRHGHPRPQLPYLYHHPPFPRQTLLGPNQQIARLFSNETRRYVREQFWLATKWTLILWTFGALSLTVYAGITLEMTEHRSPTPPEWSFRTRYTLRGARQLMDAQLQESRGFAVDWARVGNWFRFALGRLEDPKMEGTDIVEVGGEGEQILIPGLGKAGYDVSAKSWPWRSGYFEVIMGCGLAAEHLDGMILDKTDHTVVGEEFVIGPSNPDPRPKTMFMTKSPREEDCVPASDPPETFYMRILTGKGFTTMQRMEAAKAYANWLDIKGLPESAEEMYRWSVDIAKSAIPSHVDPESVIDSNTTVLRTGNGVNEVTPNLLRAATDMAIHHARNNNVSSALPILLSVLRVRRSAPRSPFPPTPPPPAASGPDIGSMVSSFLHGSQFPLPPPSGDIPTVRSTDQPTCEDSELMLYIGEILFATSASEEGLGWTRQAVTIADANLSAAFPSAVPGTDVASEKKKKCKECLITGVGNWEAMLQQISEKKNSAVSKRTDGWFSWGASKSDQKVDKLTDEWSRLEALKDRLAREGVEQQWATYKTS